MLPVTGLHHVTAFAGDAARNYAFYTEILGLRMVKKTVNFDDPTTYHLYYGDEKGSAGTALTFFPLMNVPRGRIGAGQAAYTSFAIPEAAVSFWMDRLTNYALTPKLEKAFGHTVISFADHDGMALQLVAVKSNLPKGFSQGEIPADYSLRGFFSQSLVMSRGIDATIQILTNAFGYRFVGEENGVKRYEAQSQELGRFIDIIEQHERGAEGAGTIHHIAFRAKDDTHQEALAGIIRTQGHFVTEQKDRNYFRSVYFRLPSGILFEIATDDPGFAVDEPQATLGSTLMLPPWLEKKRDEITAQLPALAV